jgi:hypothetical protein
VSKRRMWSLIALVWAAAAGLCALPVLWHPFRQYMETLDLALMFGTGWIAHGNRERRRARMNAELNNPPGAEDSSS